MRSSRSLMRQFAGASNPVTHATLVTCLLALLPAAALSDWQAGLPLTGGLDFANYGSECERPIPLPEPTGHHQVGTLTYHWVDRSRPELLSPDTHDDRQVIVTLFYPALRVPDGPPASYVPGLDLLRAGFATDRREVPRRIAEDLSIRGCVLTHAFANRPIAGREGQYPVVLVSPGGNVSRYSHTALAQELASQGWVVAVMSHAYSGWDVFPEGGHVMSSDHWNAPDGASDAERARLDNERTAMLAADASFALDRLAGLAQADPHGRFTARLDTAHVAIIGHSRGGSTVGRSCTDDERFAACVILDNIGPDPEVAAGLRQPQLSIRRPWTDERTRKLHDFLGRNATVAVDAAIDGAVHMSFTDLPLIDPAGYESAIAPARAHAIVAALILAFIDEHARGDSRRPGQGLPQFPQVTMRTFGQASFTPANQDTGRAGGEHVLPRRSPGEIGIPDVRIQAAHALARDLGTAAYLLVIEGHVIDSFGDLSRKYRLHSVRKGLLSALYGVTAIAAEEPGIDKLAIGALGIDDYAVLTPAERTATLADVLASRSGVYLPATHENAAWDDVRPARGSHKPGSHWFYSNWDFNVAGTAFQVLEGESIFGVFEREIARPIGMVDFDVRDGAWRYGPRSWHPAYVFRMSTRDLARFGVLMARDGAWNGRQVIPRQWVRRITARRSSAVRPDGAPMPGTGYGMSWWTLDETAAERTYGAVGEAVFVASGTGAQILLVAPGRDLVFVHRTDTDLPASEFRNVSTADAGRILKLLLAP